MPAISANAGTVGADLGDRAADPVYINGRFLVQTLSGVQRFATEIAGALLQIARERAMPEPVLLTPHPGAPDRAALPSRQVGRRGGQVWEQLDLPRHAAGGLLVNLGNTAPLFARRQVVVIHDAGVFRRPGAYTRGFRLWYRALQRLLVLRRARIVTVSQFARADIAACLHCAADSIDVIGESGGHIRAQAPDTGVLARHGLVPGRYVLVVGNLAAHKNLPALSATAVRLAARGMTLAITGGLDTGVFGRASAHLPAPATALGRVTDGELAALYHSACCFVFPSTYEGFGIPALEAMEMGCPVVAARIPALTELCGDAALFCDPADPADIANMVERLCGDGTLQNAMRSRGAVRSARYTWLGAGRQLHGIIGEMSKRKEGLLF